MAARRAPRRAQATLELLGLIPLLTGVGIAVFAGLTWLGARGEATDASLRGARALALGSDARAAALAALPSSARTRATVTVEGARVRVRLRPGGIFGGILPEATGEGRR